jgi:hypothetical protein
MRRSITAKPRSLPSHPLDGLLEPLRGRRSRRLEGPNGEAWRLEVETQVPASLASRLPPGALVFAGNGYGDHLFLAPDQRGVMVFWHEGACTAEYCPAVEDLLPNVARPPSAHGPVLYHGTQERVLLGDRVVVRYWLFFSGAGVVTYVPGISPLRRTLERDGLAWVRAKLDDGAVVDTIVIDGILKRGTRLLGRSLAPV